MKLIYKIGEVVPYINWDYFYHAWGLTGKPEAEKRQLKAEAQALLQDMEGHHHTYAIFDI
ncbi:MAG: 5-methyltetrahydrofolate--homocysteine methyltransferase, partial [Prevotella sp.]|nr:5-methyltetrahydrofolate--homocysteine methyltransferase [Prevotella sp.]